MNPHAEAILTHLKSSIKGQDKKLRWLLAAYLTQRHVLLEDRPGTGKTTLAKVLAQKLGASFNRVQFTPDLLPSDILGVSIYEPQNTSFKFHKGPIFTEILLADEINRCSPRTQSALLEAMAEKQVTIEGRQHQLHDHFFVIATQNPLQFQGTFPLPEAQLDRFGLHFSLGYLSEDEELSLLIETKTAQSTSTQQQDDTLKPTLKPKMTELFEAVPHIQVHPELCRYIVQLVQQTRQHNQLQLGASPRVSLDLMALSQALALIDGHKMVLPEHIQELWEPCCAHRLQLDPALSRSSQGTQGLLDDIVKQLPLPV